MKTEQRTERPAFETGRSANDLLGGGSDDQHSADLGLPVLDPEVARRLERLDPDRLARSVRIMVHGSNARWYAKQALLRAVAAVEHDPLDVVVDTLRTEFVTAAEAIKLVIG